MSVNKKDGKTELMVSQPGGTFVTLLGRYSKLPKQPSQEQNAEDDVKE